MVSNQCFAVHVRYHSYLLPSSSAYPCEMLLGIVQRGCYGNARNACEMHFARLQEELFCVSHDEYEQNQQ